jgi:DGQHR domain-containing protein
MTKIEARVDPDKRSVSIDVQVVRQPIGEIYIAAMNFRDLVRISRFDVRRMTREEREIETYLGIQRPLDPKRVKDLNKYVNFIDATFPSSVILAISDEYTELNGRVLTIRNFKAGEDEPSTMLSDVARVLDGQHRIAGLFEFQGQIFDVPVTIFVGADIADQAYIFSTVNLEQTKVGKSLAYDLFALSRSRSPQKVAHNIAVALDRDEGGPFERRIKRLGQTTPGRTRETITQATFVEALLDLISKEPKKDRDLLLRNMPLAAYEGKENDKYCLRDFFLRGKDVAIAKIVSEYFEAVRQRWPEAWNSNAGGLMLNKSSGFRALMRFLRSVYLHEAGPGNLLTKEQVLNRLRKVEADDAFFTVDEFKPGSSGESALYRFLMQKSGLE